MNWIGKTLRSFNVSGSSAIRFLGDGNKNPEEKRFHEMVRDLDKKNGNNSIGPCIDYFIEHFGSYEISELDNLHLNREATYLILQFLPLFNETLKNHSDPNQKNSIDRGFLFLEKSIFIFIPEPKNVPLLVQIINQILETNDKVILSRSMVFVSKCLSIQILANLFYYQADSLTNLWLTCFVNNQNTCQLYGPLFTATAEIIQFNNKNPDAYKPFFNQVNESFREIKFVLNNAESEEKENRNNDLEESLSDEIKDSSISSIQNALNFVATISSKVNSGNFFSEFFIVSKIYFFNMPSLNVFSTFLTCKTSNPVAPWEAINEICKSDFSSPQLLESALEVVHSFLESPLITNFSFLIFIKRAKEISIDSQKLLFDIVDRFPLSSKLDFFTFSTPPWDTGISSELLYEDLIKKNVWGQYAIVMLSTLALKPEYNNFRDNLVKDKFVSGIVTTLIDMVSNEDEISTVLYGLFIKLANEGIKVGSHLIEKITHNENIIIYLEQFLIALREKLVCDDVFDIYSKFSRENLFFVLSFLENGGIPILFPLLKSDSSLNFLASLASNGPYDSIDSYIVEHFKGSSLSKHSHDKLMNLMMGMPQNSTSQGLLRIPSLLKFINTDELSLSTQHDRYIFGLNAHKYGIDNQDNLKKYSSTYMTSNNVDKLCHVPEMLIHITSPNYPHFSVFECHKEAPHCVATLKLEVTTTFWIYLISLSDKTIIMETPFGVIFIDSLGETANNVGISFFGLQPIKFDLKTWNMITLTATDWTFQQQQIVVYFNTTKIGEINGTVGSTVTLGSETDNNAIYYLSSSFQTFDSPVSLPDVKQMYQNGPQVFCPTLIKMKPGFQFIPYKGIAKYFEKLGGKEYIFILMKNTDDYNDLIKLIQSSFNMLNLGLIKEKFFFFALRYILYYKSELISKNNKSKGLRNKGIHFESILYEILDFDIEKKWEYKIKIFSDYNLLSSNDESFHFSLIPEIFNHSSNYSAESATKLFHCLVDSYIVFNLNPEVEKNIIKSISAYIKSNTNVLDLLLLSISAAAFVESNECSMLCLVDEKSIKKQETLFQIIIDHMDLFPQLIKFEHAMIYISTLRNELALDLLQMIAKISIINPTYFDIDVFKRHYSFLVILARYQKFWQTIMTFYTGQSADLIEDFADIPILRPQMTDTILDLLAHYIRFEISTKVENPCSFHVVKVVIKLLISSNVDFSDYTEQIQHLASLGFDQESPTPMPFSIDPNSAEQQNHNDNVVPPKVIQKLTPQKYFFKPNELSSLIRIQALDQSLYEETCLYLTKYNNSLSLMLNNILSRAYSSSDYKNLDYQRLSAPDNIEDYCKSEAVQIIANLVAMVFIKKCNSSGFSNKIFTKFLLNGCDVNQAVAQIMHKKVVFAIFASTNPSLNEESYELFVKSVAIRVFEGWWQNDDLFLLFQASFIRKTKSTKQLVFSCIIQSHNIESQIRILKELCTFSEFIDYLYEPCIFICYIQLVARFDIISNSLYPELKKELVEVLSTYINSKRALNSNENKDENNNENNENEESNSSSSTSNDPINQLLQALLNPKNDYILEWCEKYRAEDPNQSLSSKFLNDLKKDAASNSKTIRDLRYDITMPPTYFNILKYQATRIGSALYIRRAFRYQFFSRFNSANLEVESAISSLFQKEARIKFNKNPSAKSMIVPAPQPFVVPQKLDPLCYDFPIPQAKFSSLKNKQNKRECINGAFFPHSTHHMNYPTAMPELADVNQNAPKCFDGWKLPSFVMNSIPLDCQFSSFIEATSSLFDCSILMNPELLPGVAGFNNETFSIVLNAQLRNYTFLNNNKSTSDDNGFGFSLYASSIPDIPINLLQNLNSLSASSSVQMINSIVNNYQYLGNLHLRNTSEMLSHFAIIENAAHGIYGPSKLFMHHPVISFKFKDVLIAIPRRFVYQNQEVDIYFVNGLHITLIMKESDRKQLLSHIRQIQQQTTLSQIHIRSIQSSNNFLSPFGPYYAISLLAKSIEKVTKMWQMLDISNYDYLLYLNTAGGRSFNDLSQYPVFPWILGDFNKEMPVLKRDLTKPMGTQTKAREARFISTYNETEPHCHYRTHYSQPAAVLHYMMRVEPFTFFNLHLHSGLDHRDRQFSSVNDAWRSASEANLSDLKELIPEFYTMPIMFENPNNYDFQFRSDGTSLGTVVLPPWSNNNSFKFIWQMRISLECQETAQKIGNWIDLIFGYKQRGQPAIDAINVFQPLAYDNAITTIINENNNKNSGNVNGSGADVNNANADITMNYALNVNTNTNNFIENYNANPNDSFGLDSPSPISIDASIVKDYLASIEQRKALTDAILQFGECPAQLFTTPHPECDCNVELRPTIVNTNSILTKLGSFSPNCASIQFQREKDILTPFALPKFEHYVGNGSFTLARVWDGYIEFGSASPLRIDSVDSCSSTCVSSDRLILATASRNGIIYVYSCTNSKIDNNNKVPLAIVNKLICPSFDIIAMAVTTQHAMLCAVSHKHIFLFDYTTGFLTKKIAICECENHNNKHEVEDEEEDNANPLDDIISVIFDDISNFIVTISSSYITIYGLDLRFIVRSDNINEAGISSFSSISISDFPFWSKMPLYVTGHMDGSVYAWMTDVIEGSLFPLQIIDKSFTNNSPITAVSLFMNGRAVLAIDEHGSAFLATVDPIKASLLARQQKEPSCSSLSNVNLQSFFPSLNIDAPAFPAAPMQIKHVGNNDDDTSSDTPGTQSFAPSKIPSSSIAPTNFTPFANSNYSQTLLLSPYLFENCRICGASIKGGIGYRCVSCCLCVCKQCIASKRPLICSYCKSQIDATNGSPGESEENSQSATSASTNETDSPTHSEKVKSRAAKKSGVFAGAFSFKKDSKKVQAEKPTSEKNSQEAEKASEKNSQETEKSSEKNSQEIEKPSEKNSQETEKLSEKNQQEAEKHSDIENASNDKSSSTEEGNKSNNNNKSSVSNNADYESDEFDPPFININQIRRYSLRNPSFNLGQLSPPSTKKSVINFDFGINSNDSSNETLNANDQEENLPLVPIKEHHSQMMLTHTQMQMNKEQNEEDDENSNKEEDKEKEKDVSFSQVNGGSTAMNYSPDKNNDIGTVILRYREESPTRNIRRRYSFSSHSNNNNP